MEKIKKYFRYVLLLVVIYILVTVLTNWRMSTINISSKGFNYTIIPDDRIQFEIEEAENTNLKGHINLKITNKTDKLIENIYLRIDLYEDEKYLSSLYKEVKYLNVGETNRFEIEFNEKNANFAKILVTEEIEKNPIN